MNPYKRPRLSSGPLAASSFQHSPSPSSSPNPIDAESQYIKTQKSRLSTSVDSDKAAGMDEEEDDLGLDEGLEVSSRYEVEI